MTPARQVAVGAALVVVAFIIGSLGVVADTDDAATIAAMWAVLCGFTGLVLILAAAL